MLIHLPVQVYRYCDTPICRVKVVLTHSHKGNGSIKLHSTCINVIWCTGTFYCSLVTEKGCKVMLLRTFLCISTEHLQAQLQEGQLAIRYIMWKNSSIDQRFVSEHRFKCMHFDGTLVVDNVYHLTVHFYVILCQEQFSKSRFCAVQMCSKLLYA